MIKKAFALIVVILFVCIGFIGCEKHKYLDYEVVEIIDASNSEIDGYDVKLGLIGTKEELVEYATIYDYRKYPDKTATYTFYIADKYDDVFFEENALILLFICPYTPSAKAQLDSIELLDDTIMINTTYIPAKGFTISCDGPWRIEVIKIKKSEIQGITKVEENRTKK